MAPSATTAHVDRREAMMTGECCSLIDAVAAGTQVMPQTGREEQRLDEQRHPHEHPVTAIVSSSLRDDLCNGLDGDCRGDKDDKQNGDHGRDTSQSHSAQGSANHRAGNARFDYGGQRPLQ